MRRAGGTLSRSSLTSCYRNQTIIPIVDRRQGCKVGCSPEPLSLDRELHRGDAKTGQLQFGLGALPSPRHITGGALVSGNEAVRDGERVTSRMDHFRYSKSIPVVHRTRQASLGIYYSWTVVDGASSTRQSC